MALRQQFALPLITVCLVTVQASRAVKANSLELQQSEVVAPDTAGYATAAAEARDLQWASAKVPGFGQVGMAVAKPSGDGPFPTVIVFHGSHGFASEYLDLARDLARGGVLAVAVCWFSRGVGKGRSFVMPLDCPEGTPAIPLAGSEQAYVTIDAVVAAVRAMPDARDNQIALFGHSRGGGAIRNYLLRGGSAQAGIMNSAGYPASADVSRLNAPMLILHGTNDNPTEGGSEFSNIKMARGFETMLRRAGKRVDAHYYPGGTHNGLFKDRRQRSDAVRRILQFMHQHFR